MRTRISFSTGSPPSNHDPLVFLSAGQRQDERTLPETYTVRRGDTLWGIACRFYGDGTRWSALAAKNGVGDPRNLQVGTVLRL